MDRENHRLSRERANWTVALLSVLCLCIFTYLTVQWQQNGTLMPVWENNMQTGDEQMDGSYYTLYDEETGEAIEYMSRKVYPGDELLTGDNKHYKVKRWMVKRHGVSFWSKGKRSRHWQAWKILPRW